MTSIEQPYLDLLKDTLESGSKKDDRTGVGTISKFGAQMRFDLSKGFPLLTTKKINFNQIKSELLWFLHGDTNIRYLLKNKNHIWTEWGFEKWINSPNYNGPDMKDFGLRAEKDPEFKKEYLKQKKLYETMVLEDDEFANKYGDLGNVYGHQWRHWDKRDGNGFIDQLQNLINEIKTNPNSRRLIVSAWNPEDVPNSALPPCHTLFQFYVNDGKLSCQLYQRSGDEFIGIPYNIASYSLLTNLAAQVTNLEVGEFIHTIGDAHIYLNHIDQVKEQLSRTPKKEVPQLILNKHVTNINDFNMDDIKVENYNPHPFIKTSVAV